MSQAPSNETLAPAIGRRAALALPALALTSGIARGQSALRRVRIGVPTTNLNIAYPWLTIPVALGWWRAEGLDVEALPVGASLQAMQQLAAGNIEFAQMNSSVLIQANVVNDIPARVLMNNGVIDWSLAVAEDGPIRNVQDLRGRTIGVFSLATGGIAFLRAYLRANGLNPERDVQLVAVGLGAPPVEALRSGRVQGLLYWASAQASFENAGLRLRHLRGEDWASYPDFTFATLQRMVAADPALCETIARGCARASEFVMASPDCQRRIHWARWPSTRPTGAEEATLIRWDLNNLEAQLGSMRAARAMNGGQLWGRATPEAYGRIQAFMHDAGQLPRTQDPSGFIVNIADFFERINRFDAAAVRAEAGACPVA